MLTRLLPDGRTEQSSVYGLLSVSYAQLQVREKEEKQVSGRRRLETGLGVSLQAQTDPT